MLRVEKEIHNRQPPATKERADWDRFGFLPSYEGCQFQGGAIEPVTNYEDVQKWVQEYLHHENLVAQRGSAFEPGTLYPPQAWRQAHDPATDEPLGVVRDSERPPLLHSVPTSHYLRLDGVTDLVAEREGAGGFVTKIIGFLYDAPTQFHDWWFDGPISIATKSLHSAQQVLEDFVSHAYAQWKSWKPKAQQLTISALHMHGRAPGSPWYWERFAWEYTVTDACYNIADCVWPGRFRMKGKPKGKNPRHRERIELLCHEFGLRFGNKEKDWVKFVVDLRNKLIHEARWCNMPPSTKSSDEAFRAPHFLHKLNQQLIIGLLGYSNDFSKSGWLGLSNTYFDKKK
jgi:hypothetical protein